jgi:hypothetical protein
MTESLLAEWDNFYVITGSASAGLAGLTFVVIALSAESRRANFRGLRAFVTPTVVHFGAVLALAAYLSMPHQSRLSLSAAFGAGGLAGLLYVIQTAVGIRHLGGDYVPFREDWIWNVVLPAIVYAALFAAAFLIWSRPAPCMYVVAAVSVLLMFIGIHNAWDVAVWNTVRRQDDARREDESK